MFIATPPIIGVLSEKQELHLEDSLIVCVLTKVLLNTSYHGLVFIGGGDEQPLSRMVELFCGTSCKALAQKPKIFFFLAEQVAENSVITDAPLSHSPVMEIFFLSLNIEGSKMALL